MTDGSDIQGKPKTKKGLVAMKKKNLQVIIFMELGPKIFHQMITTLSPLTIDKAYGLVPDPASFQGELHGFQRLGLVPH